MFFNISKISQELHKVRRHGLKWFAISWFVRGAVLGKVPLVGLPTLAGTWYFAGLHSRIHRTGIVLINLFCILFFITHPVGGQVPFYSLFWVVPLITLFFSPAHIFIHALGSTYTTHAIGSIMWLATHASTPLFWEMLIPRVVLERFIFALGISVCYHSIRFMQYATHKVPNRLAGKLCNRAQSS